MKRIISVFVVSLFFFGVHIAPRADAASDAYEATLLDCYDGDTCTLFFANAPSFLQEQKIRFAGFDTPEIRGKCSHEKALAQQAKAVTIAYMQQNGAFHITGERGKYGRLLVSAPRLKDALMAQGLAQPYAGGSRTGWC